MAADVSSLLRVLTGYKDDRTVPNELVAGKSTALITRDLLGGGGAAAAVYGDASSKDESQELDLDLQVPTGWEKRLDLKGKKPIREGLFTKMQFFTFIIIRSQATNQSNIGKASRFKYPAITFQDHTESFDESNLELKLVSSSSTKYQSVCTLDKVKSALERAEKEPIRKRSSLWKSQLSPSYSSSSSSIREIPEEEYEEKPVSAIASVAAGCPVCLSYVLIMKSNPMCPRCNSVVPVPMLKKPRIDLNISI
ncbi:hypothetical protein GH714_039544 [Hevea brasiliensis]|uniref:Uncharacterized protein n=1 Tax=Hevea brasiliensis TaxID=3981 RepID=A0A6A6MZ30_HEVBR|nr:hypothetical protein GH714_039544 [Hevea brasiliensis]